ncbi:MAG: hypothetical protein KIT34_16145 [Cyanobacteria bacterium TGS_CYA1]|nr:hypothetical protein [Cyanobacteria bacterium TGS_CYA1]
MIDEFLISGAYIWIGRIDLLLNTPYDGYLSSWNHLAMAQTQAEAPTELYTGPEGGQPLVSDGHDVAEMLRSTFDSVKTFLSDVSGTKPDIITSTASQVVNGKAPFESVMQNLTDLKSQAS